MNGETDITAATDPHSTTGTTDPSSHRGTKFRLALLALGYLVQLSACVMVYGGDFTIYLPVLMAGFGLVSASTYRRPDLDFPSRDSFALRLIPMAGFIITAAILFYQRDSVHPMQADHCLSFAGAWLVTTRAIFHFRHLLRHGN